MPARRAGPTITELQEQIFQREGFRVSFERFGASADALPPYDYQVMAPQGWTVSDWRRVRLAPYVLLFRDVRVYRGDDTPIVRDMKLGKLRDSYYEAVYGTLSPGGEDPAPAAETKPDDKVVGIRSKRERKRP
jgi:hypothetical protein